MYYSSPQTEVQLGTTFSGDPDNGSNDHLWFVIGENGKGDFLIANITSSTGAKKYALTLKPGEHPWIRKDSDVNLADMITIRCGDLKYHLSNHYFQRQEDADPALIQKIRIFAKGSPVPSDKHKKDFLN